MAYQESTYQGDSIYTINCTGDACTGDEIRFEQAVFTGSFKSPKFSHFELITGRIIKESYGADKQQHTFTIKLEDGSKKRIKGRNLYKNGLYRKAWENEEARTAVLEEKHNRGDTARAARQQWKEEAELFGKW